MQPGFPWGNIHACVQIGVSLQAGKGRDRDAPKENLRGVTACVVTEPRATRAQARPEATCAPHSALRVGRRAALWVGTPAVRRVAFEARAVTATAWLQETAELILSRPRLVNWGLGEGDSRTRVDNAMVTS